MRRLLMGFTHGDPREVDHINRNGLDNRRLNLGMCLFDDGRNRANAGKNMTMNDRICSSPFKGVYLDRRSGKWKAQVQIGGRRKNLGRFAAPEDAARAYDAAALAEYGEFARINFPV